MHKASKVAGAAAGKVVEWAKGGRVEPAAGRQAEDPAKARAEDPAKVEERVQQEQEQAKAKAAKDPATERIPGEQTENLPDGGEARVTEEGRCKICHSPCEYEVKMSQEILQEVAGTAYEGYAGNLATRVQLLDDAMQGATRRGIRGRDYNARFLPAFKKISAETSAAHRRFVDQVKGVKLPAAEEIEGFEAGREHGMMDDPSRYEHTTRAERGREGTTYHEHVQDRVAASLPRGRCLTESTVQDFLRRQNVDIDPSAIPKKSTGIDLYVIDEGAGTVTPVDITGVAGGKSHVAKLHRDVSKVRAAFEKAHLRMTEPIEIEYSGMTLDQAAASIAAELRAFAG
jgi:hypothetical protein